MSYTVKFEKRPLKVVEKWKKSNPTMFAKLRSLIADIMLHPRTGLGHPEPLVGGNGITYSRHITAHDRIIYDVYDDVVTVLIIQVENHYDDK